MGQIGRCNTGSNNQQLNNTDAILIVTIESDATVTMTKGTISLTPTIWTLSSDNNRKQALFFIESELYDSINSWTVVASNTNNTYTKTILIDTANQYELILAPTPLYNAGYTDDVHLNCRLSEITLFSQFNNNNMSKLPVSFENDHILFNLVGAGEFKYQVIDTDTKINLNNFSSCTVEFEVVNQNKFCIFGWYTDNNTYATIQQAGTISKSLESLSIGTHTETLDISSLTGDYYFSFRIFVGISSDAHGKFKLNKVVLNP